MTVISLSCQGSVPEATQLKFWKTSLDTIQHLQNFSQQGNKEVVDPQVASVLLTHLAHSPHLLPTLKVGTRHWYCAKKILTKTDEVDGTGSPVPSLTSHGCCLSHTFSALFYWTCTQRHHSLMMRISFSKCGVIHVWLMHDSEADGQAFLLCLYILSFSSTWGCLLV